MIVFMLKKLRWITSKIYSRKREILDDVVEYTYSILFVRVRYIKNRHVKKTGYHEPYPYGIQFGDHILITFPDSWLEIGCSWRVQKESLDV